MTLFHPITLNESKGILKIGLMQKYLKNLQVKDNLFKAFKKVRLHIDKELYKKAKYGAQELIAAKKQAFFDKKLSEIVGKPKELWNTLKSLGMPKKRIVSNFNVIDNNMSLKSDIKTFQKNFQTFLLKFSRICTW